MLMNVTLQGDFMLSQEVEFVNRGKSEVHLTGYQTTTVVMDPEADLESDEEDDIDMDQHILVSFSNSLTKVIDNPEPSSASTSCFSCHASHYDPEFSNLMGLWAQRFMRLQH